MNPAPCPPATPRVSVAMITYNHVRYITEAVESVVSQKTTFPFEVVIGDDVSTDGTREKVIELQRQYPDKSRLLLHEKNLGGVGKPNFAATLTACRGDYIAYLEGDDYWDATDKLQRQVEFLEAHPEYVGCFHDIRMLITGTGIKEHSMTYPPETVRVGLSQMLQNGFPHLMTMMYRRGTVAAFPDWFFEMGMGDWAFFSMLVSKGPMAFLRNWPAGVYRIHGTSYWLGRPFVDRTLDEIKAYRTLMRVYGPEHHPVLQHKLNMHQFWLINAHQEQKNPAAARAAFWEAVRGWPRYRGVSLINVIRYALSLYVPWLLAGLRRLRHGSNPAPSP